MLESDYSSELARLLETVRSRIVVAPVFRDLFSRQGALPAVTQDSRQHTRFHFPSRAILELASSVKGIEREHEFCQIYTKDLSRGGMSFLHADQLFPGEEVLVWLGNGKASCLILRCTRYGERCYAIGAAFANYVTEGRWNSL